MRSLSYLLALQYPPPLPLPSPACLQYAGLTDAVNGLSGATILAPTNDAFAELLDALNATALTDITPQDVASVSATAARPLEVGNGR